MTPWGAYVRHQAEVLTGLRPGPVALVAVAPRPRDLVATRELAAVAHHYATTVGRS